MVITASELRTNIGKYLLLAGKQEIYITKNGKSIAKLTSASADRVAVLDSLVGVVPKEAAPQGSIKGERLARK